MARYFYKLLNMPSQVNDEFVNSMSHQRNSSLEELKMLLKILNSGMDGMYTEILFNF